jgi:hypothetical protein
MMLGVSYDDEVATEEKSKKQFFKARKKTVDEQTAAPVASEIAEEVVVQTAPTLNAVVEVEPVASIEVQVSETTPEIEPVINPELEAVVAIDDEHPHVVVIEHKEEETPAPAVATRNMQDLFGARPRTQVSFDSEVSKFDSKAHDIVKKEKPAKQLKFNPKKVAQWIAYPLAIVAFFAYIFGPAGISVTHPDKGIQTTLSTADNALVVVKSADSYQVGDNVVATAEDAEKSTIFGTIAAKSDTEFILTENNLYHSALVSEVKGKAVLVMPGLGFLAGLLGY